MLLSCRSIIEVMIVLNPQVTELAEGYAVIARFMETMRGKWLPGFERSYMRRSQEYQQALAKYEKRGLFMRTLLRKPKKPQRLPASYVADVEETLWQQWREAIAAQDAAKDNGLLEGIDQDMDDRFLAIRNGQLADQVTVALIVCGPPGAMLLAAADANATKRMIQQLITGTELAEAPIVIADGADQAATIPSQPILAPQQVYLLADIILARHQSYTPGQQVSAAQAAEKAAEREKYNLLKQAATL